MLPTISKPRAVTVLSRDEFLDEFQHDYRAGQHVTLLGPTQRGKTYVSQEMLARVISPQLPCIILAGKPGERDKTMSGVADRLHLRRTAEWPPEWRPSDRKLSGYVLQPKHSMKDLKADEENLEEQFGRALRSAYASQTPVIVVADEAYQLQNDLKLKREYEAILLRGAPVIAMWSLLQRGRYSSYLAYDAPEHVLMFFEPDVSNVRRYAEMVGGVDPVFVANIVRQLKTKRTAKGNTISEFLYIRRSGNFLAIVQPD